MNNKKFTHTLTIGFALFAMFFGAGNLLLPPHIGVKVGNEFLIAILAFGLSGILLPFTGILAVIKFGDSFNDLGAIISSKLSTIIGTIIMICIGPLIAIPRTAAVTYEVGVSTFFPSVGAFIPCLLFFIITIALSIRPSKIVDVIGNVLTPILLVLLALLIFAGVINPQSATEQTELNMINAFSYAFTEGYQTLDVLASVIFAGIIIKATKAKGYTDNKSKTQVVIISGVISVLSLLFVYGGLIYLGASSGIYDTGISRSELLITIAANILGEYGLIAIALAMGFACLTTAIALTTAAGLFFSDLTNGKIKYEAFVIICALVSLFLSIYGVDAIINFAYPPLAFVYPITITLILYALFFGGFVKVKQAYVGAILATSIIALLMVIKLIYEMNNVVTPSFDAFLNQIPLFDFGLGWVLPSLIGFVVGYFIGKKNEPQSV
ncbi:branched-chain amino acid transport system II carrier protein [Flavobacterium agricola]|uniref:Branched-chain amino acid transport system II carrier protein n=1 Tax=Flavobacterium agricola TaxID=2870839 RepID=A0ABY6LYX6_9FLAO|nr:branched-chain amino acid transport system II carrier protein [Flavobacterium agricola]UYW00609.1 branched-chain amino acid transport system II carrier protein [Flavobacterium agricola]